MVLRARLDTGILCIVAALGLAVASDFVSRIWGWVLPSIGTTDETGFYYSLHVFWIPFIMDLIIACAAALLVVGYLVVRARHTEMTLMEGPVLNRARLALIIAVAAAGGRFITGLVMGFVAVVDLRPALLVEDVILTANLGLFLYWLLGALGAHYVRLAGPLAIAFGVAGAIFAGLRWSVQGGVDASEATTSVALVFGFLSLILWFALYLSAYVALHRHRTSRPPSPTLS